MIIDYKWETYTRNFFLKNFAFFSSFCFLFYLDANYLGLEVDEVITAGRISIRLLCSVCIGFLLANEVKLFMKGKYMYATDHYNIFILGLYLGYYYYLILTIFFSGSDLIQRQIICTFLWLLILIDINCYVSINRKFGFLVSMMKEVAVDLKYFLLFYLTVLTIFSLIF